MQLREPLFNITEKTMMVCLAGFYVARSAHRYLKETEYGREYVIPNR